jgi:hypothetical protein
MCVCERARACVCKYVLEEISLYMYIQITLYPHTHSHTYIVLVVTDAECMDVEGTWTTYPLGVHWTYHTQIVIWIVIHSILFIISLCVSCVNSAFFAVLYYHNKIGEGMGSGCVCVCVMIGVGNLCSYARLLHTPHTTHTQHTTHPPHILHNHSPTTHPQRRPLLATSGREEEAARPRHASAARADASAQAL